MSSLQKSGPQIRIVTLLSAVLIISLAGVLVVGQLLA